MKSVCLYLLIFAIAAASPFGAFSEYNLTVLDPQNRWRSDRGSIDEMIVTVKPQGLYMEIGAYITFSARYADFSNTGNNLEIEFKFELPNKSIVNDSWLWVGDTIVEAELIDKWSASLIYEGIVNRRKDPSILFKTSQTKYEMRIYPLDYHESRKVKISYMVPVEWMEDNVSVDLPFEFLSLSKSDDINTVLRVYTDESFLNPKITGLEHMTFEKKVDDDNQTYQSIKMIGSDARKAYRLEMPNPMKEGVYFTCSQTENENYYQLAFNPSKALDFKLPKKTIFLVDYDVTKSDISREEIFQSLRNHIKDDFSDKDSFNIILSNFTVDPVSMGWLPGDDNTVDEVFDNIDIKDLSNYSNLISLLAEGVGLASLYGDGVTILLITNSDQLGDREISNQIVTDLNKILNSDVVINIAEFGTKNIIRYYFANKYYYGNEYLYYNLARMSGGEYLHIKKYSQNFNSMLASSMNLLDGIVHAFDIHTTVANGSCYGRYYLNPYSERTYYGKPVLEIGKFLGDLPFEITASGFHKSVPFVKNIIIDENISVDPGCKAEDIWKANYMFYLETSVEQSNQVITEIIDMSMDRRILSMYTAFLALEPGMDLDSMLAENQEEDDGDVTSVISDVNVGFDIDILPNPLKTSSKIIVSSNDIVELKGLSVCIYDILGNPVYTINPQINQSSGELMFEWSGVDNDGKLLPNGNYIIVITSTEGKAVRKILILR